MFLGALVSQLIGMHLPGRDSLLVRETLEFKKPVYVDDVVIVRGTLASKSESTHLVEMTIAIERGNDTVATGVAHVKVG
jgi:3-hydroxybutyryl-CoA dehydratase